MEDRKPPELLDLNPAIEPPPDLEDAVVTALHHEELLGPPQLGSPQGVSRGWLVAAILTAFIAGATASRQLDTSPTAPLGSTEGTDRQLYALLLYEDSKFQGATDEHPLERVEEYRQWIGGLRGEGRFADGERLASTGLVLGRHGEQAAAKTLGPQGQLSGFFIVEAADDTEARTIARRCPHLHHGGTVEVRRIERDS